MGNDWLTALPIIAAVVIVVGILSDCTAGYEANVRDHQYRMKQLELNCPGVEAIKLANGD